MPFSATVLNVLIASPSDVASEREAIADALYEWNALNAAVTGYVLLPVRWESHSAPTMGERPQGIINNQVVRNCDILIGAFWTRLGSPTGIEVSGTVEEIRYFLRHSRPVMLYFSDAPVTPKLIDHEQMKALAEFRSSIRDQGIQYEYSSIEDLKHALSRHLTIVVREITVGTTVTKSLNKAIIADDAMEKPSATEIVLRDYTDRSFVVMGDTKDFKEKLSAAGGKWMKTKFGSFAWMFSKRHLKEVAKIVSMEPTLVE